MKIYLDYDSTLVNFIDVWVDQINIQTEDTISLDEINQFHHPILGKHDWLFMEYNIYNHITPFEGAIDFVNSLCRHHDVTILTHTLSELGATWKRNHIDEYFGDIKAIFTDQPKHIFSNDGILIDDGIHNVIGHVLNSENHAILFNFDNRYSYIPSRDLQRNISYLSDYKAILNLLGVTHD